VATKEKASLSEVENKAIVSLGYTTRKSSLFGSVCVSLNVKWNVEEEDFGEGITILSNFSQIWQRDPS
jgi:hypothetical protein